MVHIGALERVAQELSLDLLAVAAEPFAVSRSVLGNDGNSNFTAILADVGVEQLTLRSLMMAALKGQRCLVLARRSFTEAIASDMNLSYKDAEKLKVNIGHQQIKPTVKKEVEESIDKTLEVWIAGVELALE